MGNSGDLGPAVGEAVWGGCLGGHFLLDFLILLQFQTHCTMYLTFSTITRVASRPRAWVETWPQQRKTSEGHTERFIPDVLRTSAARPGGGEYLLRSCGWVVLARPCPGDLHGFTTSSHCCGSRLFGACPGGCQPQPHACAPSDPRWGLVRVGCLERHPTLCSQAGHRSGRTLTTANPSSR